MPASWATVLIRAGLIVVSAKIAGTPVFLIESTNFCTVWALGCSSVLIPINVPAIARRLVHNIEKHHVLLLAYVYLLESSLFVD
jgi:hypothetical protein